jgi:hypothetical protein
VKETDKTLIQRTVYFYASDIEAWNNVENKARWLHEALNTGLATIPPKTKTKDIEPAYFEDQGTPQIQESKKRLGDSNQEKFIEPLFRNRKKGKL